MCNRANGCHMIFYSSSSSRFHGKGISGFGKSLNIFFLTQTCFNSKRCNFVALFLNLNKANRCTY